MIRTILSRLFGPRCDFGSGFGATGCLRRARWQSTRALLSGRRFVWCDTHRTHPEIERFAIPLGDAKEDTNG